MCLITDDEVHAISGISIENDDVRVHDAIEDGDGEVLYAHMVQGFLKSFMRDPQALTCSADIPVPIDCWSPTRGGKLASFGVIQTDIDYVTLAFIIYVHCSRTCLYIRVGH